MRDGRDEAGWNRHEVDRALGERARDDPDLATWAYAEGLSSIRPGEPGLPVARVDPAAIRRLPVRVTALLAAAWVLLLPPVVNTGPAGPDLPPLPLLSAAALAAAIGLGFFVLAGLIGRWPVTPTLTLAAAGLLLAVAVVDLAVGRVDVGTTVVVHLLALVGLAAVGLWGHRRRVEPAGQ